jgi:hypothetical protein
LSFFCVFSTKLAQTFSVAKFSDEGNYHQFFIPYFSTLFTEMLWSWLLCPLSW